MTNKTTQVLTTDTVEKLRQKVNDISLDVGGHSNLVSMFTDAVTDIGTSRPAGNYVFAANSNFNLNAGTQYDSVGLYGVAVGSYNKANIVVSVDGVDTDQGIGTDNYYVPHQTFVINHNDASQNWSSLLGTNVTQSGSSWGGGELVYIDDSIIVIFGSSTDFSTTNQIQISGGNNINGTAILSIEELSSLGQARVIRLVDEPDASDDIQIIDNDTISSLNELMVDIGDIDLLSTDITSRADLVSAINSEEAELNTAQEEIQTLEDRLGPSYVANQNALATSAVTVTGAIGELHSDQVTLINRVGPAFITDEDGLSIDATTLASAVNLLATRTGVNDDPSGGRINELDTTATNNVEAINELHTEINSLESSKLSLTNATAQSVNSDISLVAGNTLTINGTLDVSNGSFVAGSGASEINFTNRFISLGDGTETSPNTNGGGLIIDRGTLDNNVQIRWNETDDEWQLSDSTDTFYDIVHKGNLSDVLTDGDETGGVSISWNALTDGVDVALDTQAAFTAGQYGSSTAVPIVTVNDKGIVTDIETANISTTLSMKNTGGSTFTTSLASDTLVIDGTANEVDVTIADDSITIGLPNDVSVTGDLTVGDFALINGLRVGTTATDPGNNNLHVEGDAYVGGNLDVQGTINFVDSTTVEIGDNNIVLNAGVTGVPPIVQSGITVERGDEGNAELVFDESTDTWQVNTGSGNYVRLLTANSTISNAIAPIDAASINADMDIAFIDSTGKINDDTGNLKYNPVGGILTASTFSGALGGNATSATALETSRNIKVNSISHGFDGTSDIDLTEAIRDTIGAMVTGGTDTRITATHDDGNNVIGFVVDDVDGFGEVTTDSGTLNASGGDSSLSIVGGDDITVDGVANTSVVTVDHDDITRTDAADSTSTGVAVTGVTSNARGHITAVNTYDFDNRYLSSFSASGDVAITTAGVSSIGSRAVTSGMMPSVASNTLFGNNTASAGSMSALDSSDVITLLGLDNLETDANKYSIKVQANNDTASDVAAEGTIKLSGSGATSVSRNGNAFTISSTNSQYSASTGLDLVSGGFRLEAGNVINASINDNTLSLTRLTNNNGSFETLSFTGGETYNSGDSITVDSNNNINLDQDQRFANNKIVYVGNDHEYATYNTSGGGNITWTVAATECMKLINGTASSTSGLFVQGDIIAFSSAFSSDEKLKENIKNVDNALDKVSQLNGVEFDWKDGRGKSAGVIAQDVEKVLPQAVRDTEDLKGEEYKAVEYNQLSALMIEELKGK
jgi:hypothetical protein